jgi:hypothetical protein
MSLNDSIVTPLAGVTLGEMLHRLSSHTLDDSTCGFTRVMREILGLGISPTRGLNRLATGDMWAMGAPPIRSPARIDLQTGVEHVNAGTVRDTTRFHPSPVVTIDVEYGDLLPAPAKTTLPPYDFFDLRAGAVITTQAAKGFDVAALGLVHGWSSDVSRDEGPLRDNNVVGFVQSFDYHASDGIQFSALGVGAGDFVVFRDGPRRRLRLGVDAQWAPVAAIVSKVNPFVGTTSVRDYNFSMGASVGLSVRWDIGRVGRLALTAREYGTLVVDGYQGQEEVGYERLSYEVEAFRDLVGVGVAPRFMHRTGSYSKSRSDADTQLALELYATIKL